MDARLRELRIYTAADGAATFLQDHDIEKSKKYWTDYRRRDDAEK